MLTLEGDEVVATEPRTEPWLSTVKRGSGQQAPAPAIGTATDGALDEPSAGRHRRVAPAIGAPLAVGWPVLVGLTAAAMLAASWSQLHVTSAQPQPAEAAG